MGFYTLEVIQFVLGMVLVLGIYSLIAYYRRLLQEYSLRNIIRPSLPFAAPVIS